MGIDHTGLEPQTAPITGTVWINTLYQLTLVVDLIGQLYNLSKRIQSITNLLSEPVSDEELNETFRRQLAPNASKYHR